MASGEEGAPSSELASPGGELVSPGGRRYSTRPRKPNLILEEMKKELEGPRHDDDGEAIPAPKPKKKRSTGGGANGAVPPEPAPHTPVYHTQPPPPPATLQHISAAGPFAIILDIEGTTTPVTFVEKVLFPYAKEHLREFLAAHKADPSVRADIDKIREQAELELKEGHQTPQLPPQGTLDDPAFLDAVVARVEWEMAHNKKTPGLKGLQGHIWQEGYVSGALKGDVYEDVPQALQRWHEKGVPVVIYSSGSVQAQKLLFQHSTAGDLLPLIKDHFDLSSGSKVEPGSYQRIGAALGATYEMHRLVFATDVINEAIAARNGGVGHVVLMLRPGNLPLPPNHDFPTANTLLEVAQSVSPQ